MEVDSSKRLNSSPKENSKGYCSLPEDLLERVECCMVSLGSTHIITHTYVLFPLDVSTASLYYHVVICFCNI